MVRWAMVRGTVAGSWERGCVGWWLWWLWRMLRSQVQKTDLPATPFQRCLNGSGYFPTTGRGISVVRRRSSTSWTNNCRGLSVGGRRSGGVAVDTNWSVVLLQEKFSAGGRSRNVLSHRNHAESISHASKQYNDPTPNQTIIQSVQKQNIKSLSRQIVKQIQKRRESGKRCNGRVFRSISSLTDVGDPDCMRAMDKQVYIIPGPGPA